MAIITETLDAPASTATTYALDMGDEFRGRLVWGSDDWVRVTLQAGHTYAFGAIAVGVLDTGLSDPKLILRNAGGAVVASNDDGGPGTSSALVWTAATTGTYYIDVKALSLGSLGDYGLSVSEGDRVSYGVELGAAVLYREGLSWSETAATPVNLTWGFRSSGTASDAQGDAAPFHRLTTAQQAAVQTALGHFAEVSGLSFTQAAPGGFTNAATILVGAYTSTTDGAGAYANFPGSTAAASSDGDLWINTDAVSGTRLPAGSYSAWVMLHELGHAMGLDHPGDYNAAPGVDITYAHDAQFAEDSTQYSVMSYFDATDTAPDAPPHFPQTLMLHDIAALQALYGVNAATRAGNSVYGFHANVGGPYDFSANRAPLLCIWDGAGVDKLDASGFGAAQVIDLAAGHFSDIGGFRKNVSIALGCRIENATGGSGADTILGNEFANRLIGAGGDDTLIGDAGNDRLYGRTGADDFVFSAGAGRDIVADFNGAEDQIWLQSSLWGDAVKTAAAVVQEFARISAGHVILDFGADEITLMTVSSVSGLDARIVLF